MIATVSLLDVRRGGCDVLDVHFVDVACSALDADADLVRRAIESLEITHPTPTGLQRVGGNYLSRRRLENCA